MPTAHTLLHKPPQRRRKPPQASATHLTNHHRISLLLMLTTLLTTTNQRFAPRIFCHALTSSARDRSRLAFSTRALTALAAANPKKKKIVFLGTPDVAAQVLQTMHKTEGDFEIAACITQPAKRGRKGKRLIPSAVEETAHELDISVYTPAVLKQNDNDILTILENEIQPDLCITAAYGQYLPKRFLRICPTINIHPSLLPHYRGASPVQSALAAGEAVTGVTVLYTVQAMDAGPICAQQEYTIQESDTTATLLPLLFEMGTQLLVDDVLPRVWDGSLTLDTATVQGTDSAKTAPLLPKTAGQMRPWRETATVCHNKWRAYSFWPPVYLYMTVKDSTDVFKVKVLESRLLTLTQTPTRDIVAGHAAKTDGLYVTCVDGSVLELLRIQTDRKPFPARDLQNGYRDQTLQWVEQDDVVEEK